MKDAGDKYTPANHPVSGFPLIGSVYLTANRLPLTAITYFFLGAATSVTKTAVLGEWPE